MKIKAYGNKLETSDIKIIRKMISFISDDSVDINDIRSFTPSADENTLLLIYGKKAREACDNLICLYKVEFPEISKLNLSSNNLKNREEAYKKLKKLKKILNSGDLDIISKDDSEIETKKLNEGSLPNITTTQIKKLEEHQKQQNSSHWEGLTKNGKTIRISIEPEYKSADINLTFAELYAVLGLIETFQVKELEIVYKSSSTNSS